MWMLPKCTCAFPTHALCGIIHLGDLMIRFPSGANAHNPPPATRHYWKRSTKVEPTSRTKSRTNSNKKYSTTKMRAKPLETHPASAKSSKPPPLSPPGFGQARSPAQVHTVAPDPTYDSYEEELEFREPPRHRMRAFNNYSCDTCATSDTYAPCGGL